VTSSIHWCVDAVAWKVIQLLNNYLVFVITRPSVTSGNVEQEGRALRRKQPPRDATFAQTHIVFHTKFGDAALELDR